MKQKKKSDWKTLREEILTAPNWIVNLDANDVDTVADADDDTVVVVEAIEENVTENRFQTLSKSLLEQLSLVDFTSQSSIAMLIFLQFPLSSPIKITEMNYVNELMDNIIPKDMDCEIRWGMSPREDTISRIVCAIKTK